MTREEQIIAKSKEYYEKPNIQMRVGFIEGAQWADAHPQFSREEFIEKAAEWIRDNVYLYVSDLSGDVHEQQLTEAFIAAMEE